MSPMLVLTWANFEQWLEVAVPTIAREFPGIKVIYGPPRGGLCPAVALSHRLDIPMVTSIAELAERQIIYNIRQDEILWVDEIVDTGRQLNAFKQVWPKARTFSWVIKPIGGRIAGTEHLAGQICPQDTWVVFPWESRKPDAIEKEIANASRV